jgi:hypothetical protein
MSTKINVIVGDQRLLQDNKTRAAANQQALDSRTQQQQLEQQAANAIEEADADQVRSGAPTLVTERRPAAQSSTKRQQKAFSIQRLSFPTQSLIYDYKKIDAPTWPIKVTTSYTGDPARISCPAIPQFPSLPDGYTLANYHTDTIEAPAVHTNFYYNYKETFSPTLRQYTYDSVESVNTVNTLRTQTKLNLFGYQSDNVVILLYWVAYVLSAVYAIRATCYTPPDDPGSIDGRFYVKYTKLPKTVESFAQPFPVNTFSSAAYVERIVKTTTQEFTYVSYLVRVRTYTPITVAGNDSSPSRNVFYPFNGSASVGVRSSGSDILTYGIAAQATVKFLGYYFIVNNKTQQIQQKVVELFSADDTFQSTNILYIPLNQLIFPGSFPFYYNDIFVENMYNSDPRKSVWLESTTNINLALDPNVGNITYYPKTGTCYIVARNGFNDGDVRLRLYVYKALLSPGLKYKAVYETALKILPKVVAEGALPAFDGFELAGSFTVDNVASTNRDVDQPIPISLYPLTVQERNTINFYQYSVLEAQ